MPRPAHLLWPILLLSCAAPGGTEAAPAELTSISLSPHAVSIGVGDSAVFQVSGQMDDGSTASVPVTWSATGGTIAEGIYHAGNAAGSYRVIATTSDGRFADTAQVTVDSVPVPVTLTSVSVTPALDTLVPAGTRTFSATGHFSNGSSAPVTVAWSATGGTINGSGVYTAGSTTGSFRVIGTHVSGNADTSTVVIKAAAPPPPPPAGGDTLLVENFDNASIGTRGWYDNTSPTISTTEKHSGAGSLQMTWNTGSDLPVNGGALRHLFTASDRIYLRYWVKYSTNFVGSGKPYHPHEIQFLTDKDDMWIGPSATHLTTYVEHNWTANGGVPRLAATDVLNIDQTKIGVDLTGVTENRAVAGCNGNSDGYPTGCYPFGNISYNEKVWLGPNAVFSNNSGSAGYKNNWHKVEVVYQMNSVVGGKGQNDGVAQYWFDGQLQIDLHNVLLRTGANATMKFNQILLAFYIGDLSPATQTVWIDDLIVATGPVP